MSFCLGGGGSNVNFRQVLVDNTWPNKSSVFFCFWEELFHAIALRFNFWPQYGNHVIDCLNQQEPGSFERSMKNLLLLQAILVTSVTLSWFQWQNPLTLSSPNIPNFGCNNLEALHARLQGFPTSGMALNTFSLYCPQNGDELCEKHQTEFFWSLQVLPKETCHHVDV